MNKKGQNITISTIILIVLALIVLVVLVIGFTGGWGNLWGRITSFFGGGTNIDTIVQSCQLACTTQAKYDFCTRQRSVRADTEIFMVDATGNIKKTPAEGEELTKAKEGKATCKDLAAWHPDLGFEPCSGLCPSS